MNTYIHTYIRACIICTHRYGDKIDPRADAKSLARAWCLAKPNAGICMYVCMYLQNVFAKSCGVWLMCVYMWCLAKLVQVYVCMYVCIRTRTQNTGLLYVVMMGTGGGMS